MNVFPPGSGPIPRPTFARRCAAITYDVALTQGEHRGMASHRAAVLAAATGEVLEIGAGTGLNLRHYPGGIRLTLTEPDPGMRYRLARAVERRASRPRTTGQRTTGQRTIGQRDDGRRTTGFPEAVAIRPDSAQMLEFPPATFDTVVSTLVLCTVPEPETALAEMIRVLRPGGRVVLIEHVRSDRPAQARRQTRWARLWARTAGGCRCDQDTGTLLQKAGFEVDELEHQQWRGMPGIVRPLIMGTLTKPTPPIS